MDLQEGVKRMGWKTQGSEGVQVQETSQRLELRTKDIGKKLLLQPDGLDSSSPIWESKEAQVRDTGAEMNQVDANLQDHLALQKEALFSTIELYWERQLWDGKTIKNSGKKKNLVLGSLTLKRLLSIYSSNLLFYR